MGPNDHTLCISRGHWDYCIGASVDSSETNLGMTEAIEILVVIL